MGKRQRLEDRDRSLAWLEGENWGTPEFDSYVVRTSHALRRKPLRDLTAEEIRLALGQPPFEPSLPYLVPLALELLKDDPLLAVASYDGDLLRNLLRIPESYWAQWPEQKAEATRLAEEALRIYEAEKEKAEDRRSKVDDLAIEAVLNFRLP